jgi:serine/threonine protein kinase
MKTECLFTDGFSEDRLLGRGGFSKVYLGITRRSKMKIAIKLLNVNQADPESLDRQLNYEIDQVQTRCYEFYYSWFLVMILLVEKTCCQK